MSRAGTLEGPRTFSMTVPSCFTIYDHANNKWTDAALPAPATNSPNGWLAVGTHGMYYETYIDLSGYELDDLTLFPSEALLQDPGLYAITPTPPNTLTTYPLMWVMDVMSQERLSQSTLNTMLDTTLNEFNNAPGMMATDINDSEITMGALRIMGQSSQITGTGESIPYITQNASTFGTGGPIVVQKLWCYRFIYAIGVEHSNLVIQASRFVMMGVVDKEKDLIYIQRLKRTYENQGSV